MKNAIGEYQRILVLGGRSDIGLAVAARLSSPFTKEVLLAGRKMTQEDVENFRHRLADRNLASIEVSCHEFDAVDHSSHTSVVQGLGTSSIDLVIVAFGQLGDQEELHSHPAAAADLVSVNMGGVVSASLACALKLESQGSGHMVFLSSVAGVRARKSNYIYGSTKAGMDAFAQGLADDLVSKGVVVTIVRPGFVHSAMTAGMKAAPFATTVEDVAERVADGMRRGSSVIWAPGVLRYVFALLRILPTAVWRRLPIN